MAPSSSIVSRGVYDSLQEQLRDPNGTQNPVFYGVTIPFYIFMVPIFFARMYTRIFPTRRLWWDDFFIAIAFVSTLYWNFGCQISITNLTNARIKHSQMLQTVLFGLALRITTLTGGHHIVFVPVDKLASAFKLGF